MGSIIMERVDIKQVRSNPDNPRFIKGNKFEKLVKSIKEFPQMLDLRPSSESGYDRTRREYEIEGL